MPDHEPPIDTRSVFREPRYMRFWFARICSTISFQMAAVAVLSYLMTKNAIGAVSTHDLDLVKQPAIATGCQPVHFRESFITEGAETRMVFDYLMRPGVAPTTNVPFLLKAVGLPCSRETSYL